MTRRGRLLAASLALVLCAGTAEAKVGAVIVAWGEIEAATGRPLGPDYQERSLGQGRELSDARYVNHETQIPAQLCRRFGITAWLTLGPGDAAPERILLRLRHPELIRPDGVSGSEDDLLVPVNRGSIMDAFTFDEPYEVQPGDWTFELLSGTDVLAAHTFTVVPPAPGSPRTVCPEPAVS